MDRLALVVVSLVVVAVSGCASVREGGASARVSPTYGSVLPAAPEDVWQATERAFARLSGGRAELDEGERTARMRYEGAEVVASLRAHTSGGTIVRVGAKREGVEDTELGSRVLVAIQRELLP